MVPEGQKTTAKTDTVEVVGTETGRSNGGRLRGNNNGTI